MSRALLGNLFVIALVLPLVGAIASLATRRFPWNNTVVQIIFAVSGACGLLAVISFYVSLAQGSIVSVILPGAFGFAAGPVSVFFLMLIYAGALLTSVYSIASLPPYKDTYALPWINAASAFFILGMQATVLSQSLFMFLLFWEVMSVAAYFLVIADRSDESLHAGWLYFVMTHIGFACLSAGFLVLAQGNLFAVWAGIAVSAAGLPPLVLMSAFFLLLAGFGSKAGLLPLHQWLPYAHPQAPSGSSALLSGVMLKVALFGFILATGLFPSIPFLWALVIVGVGLVSAFSGALHAVVENDAKRLLAWSSIENMGLIFSGVGVYLVLRGTNEAALAAAASGVALFIALHILNHFIFKTGLFMAVGAVASQTHTRDLDHLGGLAQKWPLFSGVFLALSLAAAALPPFGTFFGEWALFQSLALGMASSSEIVVAGLALGLALCALVAGLAIFAYVKMFSVIFLGRARTPHAEVSTPMSRLLVLPPLACAVLSGLVGLCALPLLAAPAQTSEFAHLAASIVIIPGASINAWLVVALALIVGVVLFVFRRTATNMSPVRATGTWDCGTPLSPRMQYTATGFAAPVRFFFRSILLAHKELVHEPVSPANPWIARRKLVWSVSSFTEHWLYRPTGILVVRAASFVKRLQSGVIQVYLLLILCTLIGALIAAL